MKADERNGSGVYVKNRIVPRPGERITFDNTYGKMRLDEIVMRGLDVHIEAMSKRNYVIILRGDGREIYLNARDLWIYEAEGIDNLSMLGEPE